MDICEILFEPVEVDYLGEFFSRKLKKIRPRTYFWVDEKINYICGNADEFNFFTSIMLLLFILYMTIRTVVLCFLPSTLLFLILAFLISISK